MAIIKRVNLTLYNYLHCPFCVRVRMALGYLKLPYHSEVLFYDDEATPIALTGKKILPILKADDQVMDESLDIIAFVDKQNIFKTQDIVKSDEFKKLEKLLNELGSYVHSLAMPYWIWTPEFNSSSRVYFQKKKEIKRGPFSELVKNKDHYIQGITPLLEQIENDLSDFYKSQHLSLNDILIASHIWGLYVVPEFQFSPKIHHYLQRIKKECGFNYHNDAWSSLEDIS